MFAQFSRSWTTINNRAERAGSACSGCMRIRMPPVLKYLPINISRHADFGTGITNAMGISNAMGITNAAGITNAMGVNSGCTKQFYIILDSEFHLAISRFRNLSIFSMSLQRWSVRYHLFDACIYDYQLLCSVDCIVIWCLTPDYILVAFALFLFTVRDPNRIPIHVTFFYWRCILFLHFISKSLF